MLMSAITSYRAPNILFLVMHNRCVIFSMPLACAAVNQRGTAVELSDTHLDREPSTTADQLGRRAQYANGRYKERTLDITRHNTR